MVYYLYYSSSSIELCLGHHDYVEYLWLNYGFIGQDYVEVFVVEL
jgi:hypothetical protein